MNNWQSDDERKSNYCERISACHSRSCENKGNADFSVLGEDGNEYCSLECAEEEALEVRCEGGDDNG